MVIDQRVLDAGSAIQDRILSHELAHVLRNDHVVNAASRSRQTVCGALFVGALASALLGLAGGPNGPWIGVLLTVTVALVLVAMAVYGAATRPRELAADRLALERFGVGFDTELADWMTHNGFRASPGPLVVFSTHPSHRRRVLSNRPVEPGPR